MSRLDFSSIKPHREEFTGPEDSGNFILTSASADAAILYRNANAAAATWDGTKVVKLGNVADSEAILVGACVYKVGSKEPVGADFIRAWPPEVMEALHRRILDVSPGLQTKTPKKTLLEQRDLIEKQLAALENAPDPKGRSKAGLASST